MRGRKLYGAHRPNQARQSAGRLRWPGEKAVVEQANLGIDAGRPRCRQVVRGRERHEVAQEMDRYRSRRWVAAYFAAMDDAMADAADAIRRYVVRASRAGKTTRLLPMRRRRPAAGRHRPIPCPTQPCLEMRDVRPARRSAQQPGCSGIPVSCLNSANLIELDPALRVRRGIGHRQVFAVARMHHGHRDGGRGDARFRRIGSGSEHDRHAGTEDDAGGIGAGQVFQLFANHVVDLMSGTSRISAATGHRRADALGGGGDGRNRIVESQRAVEGCRRRSGRGRPSCTARRHRGWPVSSASRSPDRGEDGDLRFDRRSTRARSMAFWTMSTLSSSVGWIVHRRVGGSATAADRWGTSIRKTWLMRRGACAVRWTLSTTPAINCRYAGEPLHQGGHFCPCAPVQRRAAGGGGVMGRRAAGSRPGRASAARGPGCAPSGPTSVGVGEVPASRAMMAAQRFCVAGEPWLMAIGARPRVIDSRCS